MKKITQPIVAVGIVNPKMTKVGKQAVTDESEAAARERNKGNVEAATAARENLPVADIKVDQTGAGTGAVALRPTMQMHEGIERPAELDGRTYKIKSPLTEQGIYVTINNIVLNAGTPDETVRPYEIFLMSKNLEAQQWMTALTRMMSAVFRKGGDVTFMVRELKEVYDPRGGYIIPGGGVMPSIVAEIGVVVERHLLSLGLMRKEALSPEAAAMIAEKASVVGDAMKNATLCAKCGEQKVVILDGCQTCLSCGNSKCG